MIKLSSNVLIYRWLMKCTNQYQTETILIFLLKTEAIQPGEYKLIELGIAIIGGDPGQKCSRAGDVMQ